MRNRFSPGTTVKKTPKTPKLVISGIGCNCRAQLAMISPDEFFPSYYFLPSKHQIGSKSSFDGSPSSSRWLSAALGGWPIGTTSADSESSSTLKILDKLMPFQEYSIGSFHNVIDSEFLSQVASEGNAQRQELKMKFPLNFMLLGGTRVWKCKGLFDK